MAKLGSHLSSGNTLEFFAKLSENSRMATVEVAAVFFCGDEYAPPPNAGAVNARDADAVEAKSPADEKLAAV